MNDHAGSGVAGGGDAVSVHAGRGKADGNDVVSVHVGFDDEALAQLANAGLVRRAAKLVGEASWAGGHVVRVGGFDVTLDPRGPAFARCPCPASGVCVHVVAAAQAARERALAAARERALAGGGANKESRERALDGGADEDGLDRALAGGADEDGQERALGDDGGDGRGQEQVLADGGANMPGRERALDGDVDKDSWERALNRGDVDDDGPGDTPSDNGPGATPSDNGPGAPPSDNGPGAAPSDNGLGAAPSDNGPSDGPSVLDEALGLDPTALFRRAGIRAVRTAHGRCAREAPVTLDVDGPRLKIAWPGSPTVTYIAGAGWDGMVSGGAAADRAALRLEALARLFRDRGVAWAWPEAVAGQGRTDGLSRGKADLCAAVRDEAARLVAAGLSHLGDDAADRLAGLATDARTGGLPLLGRLLGVAAAQAEALAARRDDVSEAGLTGALARVWALTRALAAADERSWPRLRGVARRDFEEAPEALSLLPLGATWWVSDSGARGVTLFCWDAEAGEARTATTARPAGTDPGFYREAFLKGAQALWGVQLPSLLEGPFRLDGPRLAPDGVVSPTARGVTRLGGLDEASLRAVAAALPPTGVAGMGLAATGSPVTVVEADGFGRMDIDEPAQEVAWAVPLAGGGELHLRQPVTPATTARVEALLGLEAAKGRLAYVVAQRRTVAGRAIWEPVSVVRRGRDGLRLVAPDFHVEGASVLGVLQKRWRLWLRQRLDEGARAPEAPRTAVAVAADEVRDLAVDLSATGRSDLSPAGRERCLATAARCDDLALTSLAAAARRLAHAPDVEAILRACLLADRCAALGAERG